MGRKFEQRKKKKERINYFFKKTHYTRVIWIPWFFSSFIFISCSISFACLACAQAINLKIPKLDHRTGGFGILRWETSSCYFTGELSSRWEIYWKYFSNEFTKIFFSMHQRSNCAIFFQWRTSSSKKVRGRKRNMCTQKMSKFTQEIVLNSIEVESGNII